ncbi:MAG: hypothetical protein LBG95_03675 [Treponema sp.]|nr:hypothetical protein [Treponema sp.]
MNFFSPIRFSQPSGGCFGKCRGICFAALFAVVALAALSALAGSCLNNAQDPGPVPDELRGVWIGSGDRGTGVTLTFTAASFVYAKDFSYTVESLSFSKAANANPRTKETYPSGYRFKGTYTAGTGNFVQHIGEKADEPPVFLNKEKNALCWGSDESSQDWIFTRKK